MVTTLMFWGSWYVVWLTFVSDYYKKRSKSQPHYIPTFDWQQNNMCKKIVSISCRTSDCKNRFICTWLLIFSFIQFYVFKLLLLHCIPEVFFTNVVSFRIVYPRSKHVTLVDTETLLPKYNAAVTNTKKNL